MADTHYFYIAVIILPLLSAIAAFLWPRVEVFIGLATAVIITLLIAQWIGPDLKVAGAFYVLGGWQPPLGIALYADGLSAVMLVMTAVAGFAISLYASAYFEKKQSRDSGKELLFWPVWLIMWAALNALFLSADIFNIYVTLELVSLSAVALVALAGKPEANSAALRYLLVGLFGSLAYLFGVALLYGEYATLDYTRLGGLITATPTSIIALAMMSTGLIMKAALFPMHFWLPPAHSSAPAPVSALLSALVVKGAVYLLFRIWFNIFDEIITGFAVQLMGVLGAAAILWGSVQALRAERLKLLVAYSTVAQIGYLFLAFPLILKTGTAAAMSGAVYLMVSHALAKAAMFTSAGTIMKVAGHDRLKDLGGTSQRYPITVFTIAIAGVSLIGLPPSGGFMGKWQLLNAAFVSGQWWWVIILLLGSLLAAAYIFRVIAHAFSHLDNLPPRKTLDWRLEWPALFIATIALILGLLAYPLDGLLDIGQVLSQVPKPDTAL
ncbi:MAG: proton-conducting transporter membrane subunit [Gammaproteobacteria bacterium]|jgi:formate hydrogenlyase subunit 3/multisubunit Na+/H+ antiporter MnhD subunit